MLSRAAPGRDELKAPGPSPCRVGDNPAIRLTLRRCDMHHPDAGRVLPAVRYGITLALS